MRPGIQYDRVFCRLLLVLAAIMLQACYQDSPPSTPRDAADSLLSLLADRDWVVRRTAAESLGKIGYASKASNLLPALGDSSPEVREAAARSLGRFDAIGAEAGRRLAELLIDSSPAVRKAAAQSLSMLDVGEDGVSAIVASLSNANVEVRAAAASALLGSDIRADHEAILRAAVDAEAVIRQAAVAVLGDQVDGCGVSMLLDRLRQDVDAGVRAEAAYRLGFHGDQAVSAGLAVAADQDSSVQVRRWAKQSVAGLRR